ncbi:MAG: GNAT family N-acetyltransferase [Acidobacteriota bacterium]|nr:GNAT family N-acetyltransferase [Acidobacteriota bacterium]
MKVLETDRLALRPFTPEDAAFILRLLNESAFFQYIGDKGVRTLEQAAGYLRDGPIRSYELHGHGLMRVELKETGQAIGMCGLLRRKPDQDPDLGYAFLPEAWGQGYALEAAKCALETGAGLLGFQRILALVMPGNVRSIRLLEKIGFTWVGTTPLHPDEPPDSVYEWSPGGPARPPAPFRE